MSLKKNADGVIVREDTVEVPVTKDEIVAELNGLVTEFDDLQLRIQEAKTLLDEFEALDSQAQTQAPVEPQTQPDGSVNVPVQDQNETPAENAGETQPETPAETPTDQPQG